MWFEKGKEKMIICLTIGQNCRRRTQDFVQSLSAHLLPLTLWNNKMSLFLKVSAINSLSLFHSLAPFYLSYSNRKLLKVTSHILLERSGNDSLFLFTFFMILLQFYVLVFLIVLEKLCFY